MKIDGLVYAYCNKIIGVSYFGNITKKRVVISVYAIYCQYISGNKILLNNNNAFITYLAFVQECQTTIIHQTTIIPQETTSHVETS
jgi:hypothetical protein